MFHNLLLQSFFCVCWIYLTPMVLSPSTFLHPVSQMPNPKIHQVYNSALKNSINSFSISLMAASCCFVIIISFMSAIPFTASFMQPTSFTIIFTLDTTKPGLCAIGHFHSAISFSVSLPSWLKWVHNLALFPPHPSLSPVFSFL